MQRPLLSLRGMTSLFTSKCGKKKMITQSKVSKGPRVYDSEISDALPEFVYVGESHEPGTRLYTWGVSVTGALGRASFIKPRRDKPNQRMMAFRYLPHRLGFGDIHKIKDIACGYGFTVMVVQNRDTSWPQQCFGCGHNGDGQIGMFKPRGEDTTLDTVLEPAPFRPKQLHNLTKVLKVSAGRAHTIMSTDKEGVWSVGNNSYGQCGRDIDHNELYSHNNIYHRIRELDNLEVKQLECGQDTSFVLTEDGIIYSCGWSADGQTGRGHSKNEPKMGPIEGDLKNESIVKLSCRADCAIALNDKGEVFGWGNSEYRQLSSFIDEHQLLIPRHLPLPSYIGKVKDVGASGTACFVVNEDGQIFSWGYGYLGRGPDNKFDDEPQQIPLTLFGANELDPDTKIDSVSCGVHNIAVVNNRRHLYMWGKNEGGCTGLKHIIPQQFPLKVALPGLIVKVVCGVNHTAAIVKGFL